MRQFYAETTCCSFEAIKAQFLEQQGQVDWRGKGQTSKRYECILKGSKGDQLLYLKCSNFKNV